MKLPGSFAEKKNIVNVIIESPKDSSVKYTFDPVTEFFKLTKILPQGLAFPLHFGFIPGTKGEDGDPLDILVLMDEPSSTGCLLECNIIGVIEASQTEKGSTFRNDRIIGTSVESKRYASIKSLKDLDKYILEEVINFFITYNEMAGKKFTPLANSNAKKALSLIRKAIA